MKILILMRHAHAAPYAETDALRPLTAAGRQQAAAAARDLAQQGFKPRLLLCSPLLRARQTAQTIAGLLGLTPQTQEELDGRLSGKELADWACDIVRQHGPALLIGHNPAVSLAAGVLRGAYTSMRPAGWAAFNLTAPRAPETLFWRNYDCF